MAFNAVKEKYRSKVGEVTLGATKEQGGTRGYTITVGGEGALPFLHFEGEIPNRPVVALEVWDHAPADWNACFDSYFGDVYNDAAAWAKKCVEEYGADLIVLRLKGADPDINDASPEDCAKVVKDVLAAVECPLVVLGCGKEEKDNQVLPVVAEETSGENLLIGVAEQENYKSLTAACMVHKHNIIAQSPIDINICKQLNILITEMNLPDDRIVIDPTIAALGYGLEYGYSIMERARNGALQGDKMLGLPMIGNVGFEVWRTKEANASVEDFPAWGEQEPRGILWEATTATALLQAGMDIVVMRHPKAASLIKQNIEELMVANEV
ncbi:CO dehydrogenase/acetyl-CoA synthase subunit delta [Dethiobacter alkaliphilus]|uniref:CO dehydrogenase/acetyl-CoA synthase, delta subunit n=1 Tax=Dethiobacter alkaliphilus AHT 1 TaxID=555088 RepID=C0GF44_DETAL|nr:CO dehydrogenase/acetyl-CoA synthase subunit delta [Dethiobacter alkaliphilus]EEG78226.1 CO dehydrogenase/acetyl-CoA synthase, delta subunit [Dethiobacter alkaliphilus AHT 1]